MKLKQIVEQILLNEDQAEIKTVLREGLELVVRRSHLVYDQISNNIDAFLDTLDPLKFRNQVGVPKKVLGAGVFGAVYDLAGNKVVKLTFDYREAPFLYKVSKNHIDGMVEVDEVFQTPFGDSTVYIIIRDDLTPITQTQYSRQASEVLSDMKYGDRDIEYEDPKKREIQAALQAMYDMDPNWRGTHLENIGIQNGNIVLYDGFSKGVKYDSSMVPTINLKE